MTKKRSEGERVRALIEADRQRAQVLIRFVAGPPVAGETVKARMRRTAILLGWSGSRVREIWNGAAHRIDAHEMDALRRIVSALSKGQSENSD